MVFVYLTDRKNKAIRPQIIEKWLNNYCFYAVTYHTDFIYKICYYEIYIILLCFIYLSIYYLGSL